MYNLLRRLLFCFPTETVHHFSMNMMKLGCYAGPIRNLITKQCAPSKNTLSRELFGLRFSNPVGLAAGFDKNALYLTELEALGFGFVEIGTVTPKPQAGNDKPRLFRLPKDKALINRMGFNNDGVQVVAQRLKDWREKQRTMGNGQWATGKQQVAGNTQAEAHHGSAGNTGAHSPLTIHHSRLIIGGNIGKNKVTPNEDAWKDYEICFRALFDCVDYFVVNVSSPNTPGLRELQEKDSLRKILSHLQTINLQESVPDSDRRPKPILLKIAPDLTAQQIDDVIDLAMEIKLDGLVATNTTIHHSRLIIGGNIGKNKVTPNEDAWKDYEICFRALFDCVDYFVVNVSSPNTPGLRELQEKDSLRKILSHLQTINQQESVPDSDRRPKPILLKIAPDLTTQQIDDVIDLAMEIKLDGLVATNTTISREQLQSTEEQLQAIGAGGLSGAPVRKRSTEIVRYIHQKTRGQLPVIASGGIFTAADAKEKLDAGAALVQVWTGFIYEGPGIVKKICDGL